MPTTTREIRLASRPNGAPTPENFELAETELPDPGPGEVLVRTTYMSVDPYMRGRMNEGKSYVPPFEVGKALDGRAVGEVVASEDPKVPVGSTVQHGLGWREHAIVPGPEARLIDTDAVPAAATLGVLGSTGLTAWVGLTQVAGLKEGDVVFVSGAAGAVGSVVGQIAKLRGHTVIGSAGSAEKVAWLRDELGFDAAFDYHDGSVLEQLRAAAPDGIDVYFDNVGGEHLEAALDVLNDFGRVAACGSISSYNASSPVPGPHNMMEIVKKRLTIRGFIVSDTLELMKPFREEVGGYYAEGRIAHRETVVEGLENAPDAFIGMLEGRNTGKMLVKLS